MGIVFFKSNEIMHSTRVESYKFNIELLHNIKNVTIENVTYEKVHEN